MAWEFKETPYSQREMMMIELYKFITNSTSLVDKFYNPPTTYYIEDLKKNGNLVYDTKLNPIVTKFSAYTLQSLHTQGTLSSQMAKADSAANILDIEKLENPAEIS